MTAFHSTMVHWICQYISIYLWLPISDLFSSVLARIQTLMIEKDIAALTDPNFVPDTNNSALHHLHAHRHRGVFHHPDGIDMGDTGRRALATTASR